MGSVISLFKPECGMEIYTMNKQNASSCGKISGGVYAVIFFLIGLIISIIIHFVSKKTEETKPENERTNRPLFLFLLSISITIVISISVYFLTYLFYNSQQRKYQVQFENLKSQGISDNEAMNIISRSSDATKMTNAYRSVPNYSTIGASSLSGLIGGIIGSSLTKK